MIDILAFEYPPLQGGISRLSGEMARAFRNRGELGKVVTQGTVSGTRIQQGDDQCVLRVTDRRPVREYLAWRLLRSQPGPIIAGIWYPEGLIAACAYRRPRVVLAHGLELMPARRRLRRVVWRTLCRWVLEGSELVVANSGYTAGLVRAVAPRARVAVVPLAVDHVRFQPGSRQAARVRFGVGDVKVVSTVARIHPYKGHDIVIRALAALPSHEREQVCYLVAGNGPGVAALQRLARRLGVESQVRWLGYVAEDDLPDLYRASDLFVLCTREERKHQNVEGFGLVFLEAQACGTPVVGTMAGGIPDAIEDGVGGWMIEPDDVSALTSYMRHLVVDVGHFEEAGRDARARVLRGYTWNHYVERLSQALRENGITH